jgi:integrase
MPRKIAPMNARAPERHRYNPAGKKNKLFDGQGLFLLALPTGTKSWRWKYRYNGVERQMVLGTFPELSLADARALRGRHAEVLKGGRDPQAAKAVTAMTAPGGQTFEAVARDWYQRKGATWRQGRFAAELLRRLEVRVFPKIGATNIAAVQPQEILALCRAVEAEDKVHTAWKLFRALREIFSYAMAAQHCISNPAAAIEAALHAVPATTPRRAVTTLPEVCALLRATEAADSKALFKMALRFLALTAARPGMVLGATWDEIEGLDSNCPVWRVPACRMKMRQEWVCPLVGPALDILRAVKPLATGRYIFPDWHRGGDDKPISEYSFNHLLKRAGWLDRHSAHGFRAAFRSIMGGRRDQLVIDEEALEAQLAHGKKGKVQVAYDRNTHMERRTELCAEWAQMILSDAPDAMALLYGPHKNLTEPKIFLEAAE